MTNPKADYYLRCVAEGYAVGVPVHLRNNLDPWFAQEFGEPFLKSGGRHHHFDNPCAWEHGERLTHEHFWVTPEAEQVLAAGRRRDPAVRKGEQRASCHQLKVDHAVPFAVLEKLILDTLRGRASDRWVSDLRGLLRTYFRRGVLLKWQDEALSKGIVPGQRLQSAMPQDWDGRDVFARYKAMGYARQEFSR